MSRQVLFRVLLSFVLLFSQQMATAHALEHVGALLGGAGQVELQAGAGDDASELAKAVAQHQNCHQCLAFAQLAGPLAGSTRLFLPFEPVVHGPIRAGPGSAHSRTILARQPRGPPHA